jgi:GT2 family glycosyltransferase
MVLLSKRIDEMLANTSGKDPAISIVIRSRRNAKQLRALLDDIAGQTYSGAIEIIIVDTDSSDATVRIARQYGTTIIPMAQADFSYPKALNLGFTAAHHEWVFSFVDHSALSHSCTLKVATRWNKHMAVAGVYGATLPNNNATLSERWLYGLVFRFWLARSSHPVKKARGGFLAANAALIRRSVWKELGGFDESYGAGGEDLALGISMLKAGYDVVLEPALCLYHSHGLNLWQQFLQLRYWRSLKRSLPFDLQRLERHRPDLKRTKS